MPRKEPTRAGLRRTGFALLYVLAVLTLLGGAMYLLTDASATMAFQTREDYLDACRRNLTASALAWARHAGPRAAGEAAQGKDLDVSGLDIPGAAASVAVDQGQVTVTVSCRQGPRIVKARCTQRLE